MRVAWPFPSAPVSLASPYIKYFTLASVEKILLKKLSDTLIKNFHWGILAMENESILGLTEASKKMSRCRQCLYQAIRTGKLRANRASNGRWKITISDLQNYWENRYSRDKSLFNGQLVYDVSKGTYSVKLAAQRLNIPLQKIYFAIRSGKIDFVRKGSAYVFTEKALMNFQEKYLTKKIAIAG